jgi:hypothetical protein
MQEISIRVMNMIRRTLMEHPEVTDRTLYAAAVALEPLIGNLSLQQFRARYPGHVRRKELGERRARPSDSAIRADSFLDRPYAYAPGSDTLAAMDAASSDPVNEPTAADAPHAMGMGVVRRRIVGKAVNHEPVSNADAGEQRNRAELESAPSSREDASKDSKSNDAAPPWPLRLHPEAASREPPKRGRAEKVRNGGASGREVTPARRIEGPAEASAQDSAGASGNAARDARVLQAQRKGSRRTAAVQHDEVVRLRTETRRILFNWASEVISAESRGDLVRALASAEMHVAAIADVWTDGNGTNSRVDRDDARLSGRGSRKRSTNTGSLEPQTIPARPAIPVRKHILDYKPSELDALVQWTMSTGLCTTDDEIATAVFAELRFRRHGHRINAEIRSSLERVRADRQLQ